MTYTFAHGRADLIADHLGSIIAENGATSASQYRYGPYGEPSSWTGSRFRYTGQIALPEAQLYHYKARVYDPILGRFLQTDPIGYEDDLNLYTYVRGDPLGRIDPSGWQGRPPDDEATNPAYREEMRQRRATENLPTGPGTQFQPPRSRPDIDLQPMDPARELTGAIAGRVGVAVAAPTTPLGQLLVGTASEHLAEFAYDVAPEVVEATPEAAAATAEFMTRTPGDLTRDVFRLFTEQPPAVNPDREQQRERRW